MWYKETPVEVTCKNLGLYRYCLIKRKFNKPAPLQSCACQIKQILLYKKLELVHHLGNILLIIKFSYMDIRIYFHLVYNNTQTNRSSTDSPTLPPMHALTKKKLTFVDNGKIRLITGTHKHN
jgi:hypothetical protein